MSEEKIKALQDALALKQKELDLLMAIDEIRDGVPEPAAMATAIVDLLADRLPADLCAMILLDRQTGAPQMCALNVRCRELDLLGGAIHNESSELIARAVALDDVAIWEAKDVLPAASSVDVPENLQVAAVPIVMGDDERLGALLLARSEPSFGAHDVQLLQTAEDQIDSAVIQGYVYEQHRASVEQASQRQKELDLLMTIDEIRDCVPEPAAMAAAIVNLLADRLPADLCAMFLLDRQTGVPHMRALSVRRQELEPLGEAIARESNELLARVVALDDVAIWEGKEALSTAIAVAVPENLQVAAVPIVMGDDERLGALLLARFQPSFGAHDVRLLQTAEDQIDSAVIQGYVYEQHQASVEQANQRQKELGLLMAIDEVRDSVSEPAAMMISLVNLLADRLPADLCMMFLLDRETGVPEMKALSVRRQELGRLAGVVTRELATRAIALDGITIWEGSQDLSAAFLAAVPEGLQVVAVPIIMGANERLGALLLARSEMPFGVHDVQLLQAAEDQIDSAVIQGYIHEQNQLSAKEVETIYQIDRIRDLGLSLDEMLNRVIQMLIATVGAEMGFIMLYDRAGKRLELRATSNQDLFETWPYYEVIDRAVNEALQRSHLLCQGDLGDVLHSVMCMPLILNEQIIGVLGVVNRHGRRSFSAADCRLLNAIGSQIDTAIYERREIRRLRQVLGRSVDPRVMERLLANPDVDILKPERLALTVLYADIRGSTVLAEHTEPELFVEFIKDYLARMTDVILAQEGTVDKFVGDEVMALFGAPIPQEDHALRAVRVGLAMQTAYHELMERWRGRGVEETQIGVGIVTGRMIVGEMGGSQRSDYTVIGRDANMGRRICDVAAGGQVIVSEATYDRVKGAVEATLLPGQRFKGVDRDVTVYHITRAIKDVT
jgi:class 3 adenylate cyclase/GTP-sensing pleiotropic transcriptional regulator CodY